MSKTNDTSKFNHAKLENRVLGDSELDSVSGGAGSILGTAAGMVITAVAEGVYIPLVRAGWVRASE